MQRTIKMKEKDYLYKPVNLMAVNERLKEKLENHSFLKKLKDKIFKKKEPFSFG